jgi:hypothetical protein
MHGLRERSFLKEAGVVRQTVKSRSEAREGNHCDRATGESENKVECRHIQVLIDDA